MPSLLSTSFPSKFTFTTVCLIINFHLCFPLCCMPHKSRTVWGCYPSFAAGLVIPPTLPWTAPYTQLRCRASGLPSLSSHSHAATPGAASAARSRSCEPIGGIRVFSPFPKNRWPPSSSANTEELCDWIDWTKLVMHGFYDMWTTWNVYRAQRQFCGASGPFVTNTDS